MTITHPISAWNPLRISAHPGELLREHFLEPLGIVESDLARKLRVPAKRVEEIVQGKRAINAETALRLARFFGNSPEFWLNLQQMHDLSRARLRLAGNIERDVKTLAGV